MESPLILHGQAGTLKTQTHLWDSCFTCDTCAQSFRNSIPGTGATHRRTPHSPFQSGDVRRGRVQQLPAYIFPSLTEGQPNLVIITMPQAICVFLLDGGIQLHRLIRVQTRIIKIHHPGVLFNIRQPNSKSSLSKLQCELCKSAEVRSPDELAHVTWSFNGSQMFTMQESTQRNISTYHISQSKKIIFRYFLYILGKKLSPLISKYITNAIGHGKRTIACGLSLAFILSWIQKDCHGELEIISTIRRRKKE